MKTISILNLKGGTGLQKICDRVHRESEVRRYGKIRDK